LQEASKIPIGHSSKIVGLRPSKAKNLTSPSEKKQGKKAATYRTNIYASLEVVGM